MLFHFSILLTSLLFFLGLEFVVFQNDHVILWSVVLSLIVLQSARKIGTSIFSAATPLIFTLSSVTLLYLVDSLKQQQWLIILSTVVYYLAFLGIYRLRYYERDTTARGMMSFVAMSTNFLFYSSIYGIYLNFSIPIGVFMLAYCAVTVVVTYQYLMILDSEQARKARIYSLILGLSMAEIAWVVNFWPFGYLTTGVIVLMFYYIIWYLVESYFLNTLSKERILTQLVLSGLLIGMVLVSTRWTPMV